MNDRYEQTVSFGCGDTIISLIGMRNKLVLSKIILLTNEFSIPLEVDLAVVGYVTEIRNYKELNNALKMTLNYWKNQGLIDRRVLNDVWKFIKKSKHMQEEIQDSVDTFNYINKTKYSPNPNFKIRDEKVIFKIDHEKTDHIRITFNQHPTYHYETTLLIQSKEGCKTWVRQRRFFNANALIKQVRDWLTNLPSDREIYKVIDEIHFDIHNSLLGSKDSLDELIEKLNEIY